MKKVILIETDINLKSPEGVCHSRAGGNLHELALRPVGIPTFTGLTAERLLR